jgi:HEAT repeat protein
MTKTMTAYSQHSWAAVPAKAQLRLARSAPIENAEADIVDEYIAALRHPRAETRLRAARMLGQRREGRAIPALLAVVAARGDHDPYLLIAAVKSLGQVGDGQAVPALADLLAEPGASFLARVEAIYALAAIGGEEAWAALDKIKAAAKESYDRVRRARF